MFLIAVTFVINLNTNIFNNLQQSFLLENVARPRPHPKTYTTKETEKQYK